VKAKETVAPADLRSLRAIAEEISVLPSGESRSEMMNALCYLSDSNSRPIWETQSWIA